MQLEKFNPAREAFAPSDENPEVIFNIEALPGVVVTSFNKRTDAGDPVGAGRAVLLAGVKSIEGLQDSNGKEIKTAAQFLTALAGTGFEAAIMAELVLLKILGKSQVTAETAKNSDS